MTEKKLGFNMYASKQVYTIRKINKDGRNTLLFMILLLVILLFKIIPPALCQSVAWCFYAQEACDAPYGANMCQIALLSHELQH